MMHLFLVNLTCTSILTNVVLFWSPKAINGTVNDMYDIPASRTYKVLSMDGDHMVVSINVGVVSGGLNSLEMVM